MSSLRNRPKKPAKVRDYDIVNRPRFILSQAQRQGIIRDNLVLDYNNATMTRDYETLELYHGKVLPLLKKLLKQRNPTKVHIQWQPHNVLIKNR